MFTQTAAEDRVLAYIKKEEMNRPFGTVDIAANLKGAVPKTAPPKILLALAKKKEVVQKAYGRAASHSSIFLIVFNFIILTSGPSPVSLLHVIRRACRVCDNTGKPTSTARVLRVSTRTERHIR
ncbi:hypothetical protein OE88DRAFT_1090137 [Heliocybe sulcata]|uniref:Homologous-pairing protein 2 winged helix domain-containing protein n=1 Tax=Heliocybe sulcata TaxID=5364 RepID=A0A5C3MN02_9AGAM|nr:hypothetical protein OE88DRAFT_1090137 [Heliocybe sulcata]